MAISSATVLWVLQSVIKNICQQNLDKKVFYRGGMDGIGGKGVRGRRVGVVLWIVATLTLISYTITGGARWRGEEEQVERESMEEGAARVASVCSSLPPSSPLLSPASGPGVEVVFLPGSPRSPGLHPTQGGESC